MSSCGMLVVVAVGFVVVTSSSYLVRDTSGIRWGLILVVEQRRSECTVPSMYGPRKLPGMTGWEQLQMLPRGR